MTRALLAEFSDAESLLRAARSLSRDGQKLLDAFTPFHVEELDELLAVKPSRIRRVMLLGALLVAAFAYFLQWYSSVVNYPLNVGGRPLDSWPVFLLVPFEVGILAGTIGGLLAFLGSCGLPRLHHPLFDVIDFERASQDRFFLLAAQTEEEEERSASLRETLKRTGALNVSEQRL